MNFSKICVFLWILSCEAIPHAWNQTMGVYYIDVLSNIFEFYCFTEGNMLHSNYTNSTLREAAQKLSLANTVTNFKITNCEVTTLISILNEFETVSALDISHSNYGRRKSFDLTELLFSFNTKLLKFNMSYNALVEGLEKLSSTTLGITVMDFSHNNLEWISRWTLKRALELVNIHFNHNKIRHIDYGVFSNLNKLEFVDLSNNKLKSIENIFPKGANLHTIHMEHNPMTIFDCSLFELLKFSIDIYVSWNQTQILDISCLNKWLYLRLNDRHELLSTADNTNRLHLNHNSFRRLKMITAKSEQMQNVQTMITFMSPVLKSFERLDMRNSKLLEFDSSTLREMSTLKYLDISNCNLNHVKYPVVLGWMSFTEFYAGGNQIGNAFEILQFIGSGIKHLSLSQNFIGKINESTFSRLTNLESLFLSDTRLEITKNALNPFDKLASLQRLDISRNNFQTVNFTLLSRTLNNLTYLDVSKIQTANAEDIIKCLGSPIFYLDLSGNFIGHLNASVFDGLPNLQELYLRDTHLSIFDSNPFEALNALLYLDISYNKLNGIRIPEFQKTFAKLEYLNVSACQIENAFEIIKVLTQSINILDLSGNYIGHLNATTFVKLNDLNELLLGNTNLTFGTINPFIHLRRLHFLDISYNRLGFFNFSQLSITLRQITGLSVAGCQIKHISHIIKLITRSYSYLDLSSNTHDHNSLESEQFLTFNFVQLRNFIDLKFLNISHNRLGILNIPSKIDNLKTLDLRGNELTEIINLNEFHFPNLKSLAVTQNRLSCNYLKNLKDNWANIEFIDDSWSQKDKKRCHWDIPKSPDDSIEELERTPENLNKKSNDNLVLICVLIVVIVLLIGVIAYIMVRYIFMEMFCTEKGRRELKVQKESRRELKVSYKVKKAKGGKKCESANVNVDDHIYEEINEQNIDSYDHLKLDPLPSSSQPHYDHFYETIHEADEGQL